MRKADNLPPSCAVFTKSGNLNFLEPSGPLRACNGTVLPFTGTTLTFILALKVLRVMQYYNDYLRTQCILALVHMAL